LEKEVLEFYIEKNQDQRAVVFSFYSNSENRLQAYSLNSVSKE